MSLVRIAVVMLLSGFAAVPVAAARDDIVDYSKKDARMNAALARNQRALLNVRVPYGSAGANEYLWLTKVRRNADGSYDGIVTDVVAHVPDLHQGSSYHAARDAVADWVYRDEKGDHGGWTIRVMREDMTPAQRANDSFDFVD